MTGHLLVQNPVPHVVAPVVAPVVVAPPPAPAEAHPGKSKEEHDKEPTKPYTSGPNY